MLHLLLFRALLFVRFLVDRALFLRMHLVDDLMLLCNMLHLSVFVVHLMVTHFIKVSSLAIGVASLEELVAFSIEKPHRLRLVRL